MRGGSSSFVVVVVVVFFFFFFLIMINLKFFSSINGLAQGSPLAFERERRERERGNGPRTTQYTQGFCVKNYNLEKSSNLSLFHIFYKLFLSEVQKNTQ